MIVPDRLQPPEPSVAKVRVAERELRAACETAIRERRIDGDLQYWVDALQALYAGEDVNVYETARGGRGRVI